MAYTTQTFDQRRGFHFVRLITGVLVATLVAAVAAGAVMLSPLSNTARGLTFQSSIVDRASMSTVVPGATTTVTLRFRNAGFSSWERGGAGTQVDLGVKNDSVEFAKAGMAVGWLSDNRIATTSEEVVPPGAVGTFTFSVRAPDALGVYRIPVQLVVDGVTWLDDQGVFVVIASDFGFHSELIDQSRHPTLRAGETSGPIVVKLRNTGTREWVRGKADQQVNLGIDGGEPSLKALSIGWPSADRVAIQTEPLVLPGDEATFAFRVRAPSTPGTYPLRLRPVVDGVTWLEGDGVMSLITVTSASGQSAPQAGQTAATTFASSASVAPLSVSAGEVASITAAFTSASAATALIGLEVYTPGGTALAFQKWFDTQSFAAGEHRSYPVVWQVPANAALGTYSVNLRAYAPGWKSLFAAKDAAATFAVAAPAARAAASPNPATAAPTGGSGQGQTVPTPTPAPITAPAATPSFTSSASVTPGSVTVGGSINVSASFTSASATNALVTVSIYPPGGAIAVKQQSFDSQSFAAGQLRTYPVTWSAPPDAANGAYRVSLGVFSPGWGTQYSWNDGAASFAVTALAPSATPTPAPATAAPAPSSTVAPSPSPTAVLTPSPNPTVAPPLSPSFTQITTVSPTSIASGGTVSITTRVTSATASTAIVSLYVFAPGGTTQLNQQFFENQIFAAGQQRTYTVSWPVPSTAATGTYVVKVGVFPPGWGTRYNWFDSAATFVVTGSSATPTPAPVPAATPVPTVPPVPTAPVAFTRLVSVATTAGLLAAVGAALPGDKIVMADGIYSLTTDLLITRSGTATHPIQLVGSRAAVLDFGGPSNHRFLRLGRYMVDSDPGVDWWVLSGFTHRNSFYGPTLWNSNHNVLQGLLIEETGQEGINIKGPQGSSDNVVQDSQIRNTGRNAWYWGEGIYVGSANSPSHRNKILRNKFGPGVTAEHVELKPTTQGNLVQGNISDATGFRYTDGSDNPANQVTQGVYAQTRAASAEILDNVITNLTNPAGAGTANAFNNYFSSNVKYHGNRVTGSGYNYGFGLNGGTGNVVGCDNTISGARSGLANVPCMG